MIRPYFILFCADFYTLTSVANPIHSIAIHFISFLFILAFRAITISPGYCKLLLEMVMWFRGIVSELSVQVHDFYKSLICDKSIFSNFFPTKLNLLPKVEVMT
jgi:hypothetical protein